MMLTEITAAPGLQIQNLFHKVVPKKWLREEISAILVIACVITVPVNEAEDPPPEFDEIQVEASLPADTAGATDAGQAVFDTQSVSTRITKMSTVRN